MAIQRDKLDRDPRETDDQKPARAYLSGSRQSTGPPSPRLFRWSKQPRRRRTPITSSPRGNQKGDLGLSHPDHAKDRRCQGRSGHHQGMLRGGPKTCGMEIAASRRLSPGAGRDQGGRMR